MAQISPAQAKKLATAVANHSIAVRAAVNATYADMPVQDEDAEAGGWVHDDALIRLAWVATLQHVQALKLSGSLRLADTQLTQYASGTGDQLTAQVRTVYADASGAHLRADIFRLPADEDVGERFLIAEYHARAVPAEVTQAAASVEADAAPIEGADVPELSHRARTMETKRRQIFDGACEVIGREGYAATTMRKVAKAAGIPLSSMYQYIDTKEDLLYMITSTCMEEIFEYMYAELSTEGDAQSKMEHAVAAYLKYVSKNRRYINLAYRETRSLSRPNREKIFDIERRFTQLWEKIIIEGNASDEFDAQKTRLAANLIYFVCNLWSLRHWSVQEYSEEEVRDYLQRFVISGLKAPESA